MADNSIVGGLMGLSDPDLLLNVGLGLMSAAKYGGNVGDGISGALRNYQQQKLGTQQYQMGQMELMRQKMLMGAAMQEFGGQGQTLPAAVGMPGPPQGAPGAAPPGLMTTGAPQGGGSPSLFGGAQPPQAPPQAAAGAPSWLTPPTQNDIYNAPVPGLPSPGYIRGTSILAGRNPLPELASMREQQLKLAQQQYAPVIGRMDTLIKSDKPTTYMQADPELKAAWPVLAQHLGIDPEKELTDANVRTAFSFGRNNLASSLSQATVAPPVQQQQVSGPYGQILERNPVDNTVKSVQSPSYPSYSLQKGQTIAGQEYVTPVQTGGYRGAAPGAQVAGSAGRTAPGAAPATAGAVPPGVSSVPPGAIPTGFTPPSSEQTKSASLANYARDNIGKMQQMETSGYRLAPKARTVLINAAMNDDPNMVSQFFSQEALAHGLSDKDLAYAAAAFPILQAAGHSMAGARLTASQMRTNFESLLPVASKDSGYITTVQANRGNLYRGLLAESGQAAFLPEYAQTLAVDRQKIAAGGPLTFEGGTAAPKPLGAGESRVVNGVKITRISDTKSRGATGSF